MITVEQKSEPFTLTDYDPGSAWGEAKSTKSKKTNISRAKLVWQDQFLWKPLKYCGKTAGKEAWVSKAGLVQQVISLSERN